MHNVCWSYPLLKCLKVITWELSNVPTDNRQQGEPSHINVDGLVNSPLLEYCICTKLKLTLTAGAKDATNYYRNKKIKANSAVAIQSGRLFVSFPTRFNKV